MGKTSEIAATQSQNLSIVGFINKVNPFVGHWIKGSANAEILTKIFDDFAAQIKGKTVVIIDSCSTHTSKLFMDKINRWREQGLWVEKSAKAQPKSCLCSLNN